MAEEEPMPSTSSCHTGGMVIHREMDFSSDDSVLDPHFELPEAAADSSTSSDMSTHPDTDLRGDNPHAPESSPKKSIRITKQEKKIKRNTGQSYKTLKGKTVSSRSMKELGTCRMKCKDRMSLNDRQAIFKEYWQMGTYLKRSTYMASLMEIHDKATHRQRTLYPDQQKNRLKTYKYFLLIHGKREPICRGCLIKTLGESDNFIKTVAMKKRSSVGGTQTDDNRGKTIPKHKISNEKRQEIKEHILAFPSYESHYTRKTTSKKYLPSHLTINKMYNLFCENCDNPPSVKIYSQEFHKLGLSFKKPRADTCYTCDKFKMQIQLCQEEQVKTELIAQHEHHKIAADQAYEKKKCDTQVNKNDSTVQVYTFDLQQCLPTPALSSSVAFYKRQLWTFNLTVHDNKTGKAVCYVWYETIAARGANQIASCLFKHLKTYVPENTKHVIFYSDTCGGQNRNSHVSSMFTWALQKLDIDIIDHKFMVPGHSHLEVDTDHSIIEKKKKKTDLQIYHPHDWIQLIRSSSKKFEVVEMHSSDFLDFSSLLKGALVLRYKDVEGRQFKWLDKKWLRYNSEFGVISYKDTLDTDCQFFQLNLKRRISAIPDTIPVISVEPLPISKEKKDDLISLLSLIPDVFHRFYLDLPTVNNIPNTDPDIIDSDENE